MDDQQAALERIAHYVSERFPMYRTNQGFEQWLFRKSDGDRDTIDRYLDLLYDYGYIGSDGMLADDYDKAPDSAGVDADIQGRLARLDAETRDLLRVASVEGEHFNPELLAALQGNRGSIDELLDRALGAGVIARDENPAAIPFLTHRFRFVPLRLRDILYEELSDEKRADLHAAIVELLGEEARKQDDPGAQDMLSRLISEHNKSIARPK